MRSEYTVPEICEALEVSPSGYYKWLKAPKSPRAQANEALLQEIKTIHQNPDFKCYGSPRMVTELRNRGHQCSENRVARLMSTAGISAQHNRKWKPRTTVQNPHLKASPNLLKELGKPSGPGQVWVSDITYVFTRQKTHYLAVVMDLFTRQLIGWQFDSHMESSLVERALQQAESRYHPLKGRIFHSDRGSQYSSRLIRGHLKTHGYAQSMSALGYCYDNAACESFFATLKKERFPTDQVFENASEARRALFSYLEGFYNSRRIHTSLGNITPDEFYQLHLQTN